MWHTQICVYKSKIKIGFSHFFFADIDNNGSLDQKDFECMALRATIIEGKGECNPAKLAEYQHIMRSLWDEIADLADFDKVSIYAINFPAWVCGFVIFFIIFS